MSKIGENAQRIQEEVARAALEAGRDPSEVSILAATKYTDRAGVIELLSAGIEFIGENRVQEALAKLGPAPDGKQDDIRDEFPDCRLHMIGHLQTNKVNHALRLFNVIETVDRVSLADALEVRLTSVDGILPVFIEVKLTGEETKAGCSPAELPILLDHLWVHCPRLGVRGLMGMGPWDPNPETARPCYRSLKGLFDENRPHSPNPSLFDTISMGMSADFRVAIQEGATLVRIGRALFA